MMRPKLVLAIESAIAGGSLSLLGDGKEIANWVGSSDVSKGEDLLFNIDAMLKGNGVERGELGMIAVSAGPGSFTGIRIGIATALGLKGGLGIPMSSVSALFAMASSELAPSRITAAIPMGRNAFCYQEFEGGKPGVSECREPGTAPLTSLSTMVQNGGSTYLVHTALLQHCPAEPQVIDAGRNIARLIGLACASQAEPTVAEPLFISKSF